MSSPNFFAGYLPLPISIERFRQIAAWVCLGLWQYEYIGFFWFVTANGAQIDTLQGTNISSFKGILKMIFLFPRWDMGVSKNRGTTKSSILIGFSLINHPFWGTPIFGNTHMVVPWRVVIKLLDHLITGKLEMLMVHNSTTTAHEDYFKAIFKFDIMMLSLRNAVGKDEKECNY